MEVAVERDVILRLFLSTTFELDFVLCFWDDEICVGVVLFVFLFIFLGIDPKSVGIFLLCVNFVEGRMPVLSLLFITRFGRY